MSTAVLFLIIAIGFIAAEVLILQLTVFWFLFFGIGALITSAVCWFFPELSMAWAATLFLLFSVLSFVLLLKPLRRWQNTPGPIAGNDAIGQVVKVTEAIIPEGTGTVVWSGAEWPAQLAKGESPLNDGDSARIKKLEGIRLIVGR